MQNPLCFIVVIGVLLVLSPLASATSPISSTDYNNLVRFASFSSASYIGSFGQCGAGSPTDTASIYTTFYDSGTNTFAYLAIDTIHSQIIVVFRGTQITSASNLWTDADIVPVSFTELSQCVGAFGVPLCFVHQGFYSAWKAVEAGVISAVTSLRAQPAYASYQVVVSGHSLGGAIAALAMLKFNTLGWNPVGYTFGQPRMGEGDFASVFNTLVSANFWRGTRVSDGIPCDPPYFETPEREFYQQLDTSSLSTTVLCVGDADSNCNRGNAQVGYVAEAHTNYFGWAMGTTC